GSSTNYYDHVSAATLDIIQNHRHVVTDAIPPIPTRRSSDLKTYGDPNPTFTARYDGFVLGQTTGVLGGALAFDTLATASSPVLVYPVTTSLCTSTNYDSYFVAGTLDIAAKRLDVTADFDPTT